MCNPVTTRNPRALLEKGIHEGFEWEVTSNGIGYRCGYVRIPGGHPWHGKHYDNVEPYPDVHGGLTFAQPDTDCGTGGEDNAWWLGFDCAHAGDAADDACMDGYPDGGKRVREIEDMYPIRGDTIKTTSYAVSECQRLADQAKAAAGKGTVMHEWMRDPERRGHGLVCRHCGVTEAEMESGNGLFDLCAAPMDAAGT
jgi:hypothetical protein